MLNCCFAHIDKNMLSVLTILRGLLRALFVVFGWYLCELN